MLVDQAPELADQLPVTTQCEIGVDPNLDRSQPKLLEALAFRVAVEMEPDAGESGTAPERERFGSEGVGPLRVSRRGRLRCVAEERLEEASIEDGVAEMDAVPASTSLERDTAWNEDLPKPRHIRLDAVHGRGGRRFAPHLVDEPLDGNHLLGTKEERSEQGQLLATAELKRGVPDLGFHGTEEAESDSGRVARLA